MNLSKLSLMNKNSDRSIELNIIKFKTRNSSSQTFMLRAPLKILFVTVCV